MTKVNMVQLINKFNFLINLTMDHLIMISLTMVDLVKVSLTKIYIIILIIIKANHL
jgi:hypothetical protein